MYSFLLSNLGDVAINDLSLIDDLAATFRGNSVVIERINATGGLLVNNNYNGTSDKNLLRSGNTLARLSSGTVELQIRITLDKTDGIFNNSAVAEGNSAVDNSRISDQSTDGLKPDPLNIGDVSPAVPTAITLKKDDLFIPGGFSPNNDGINDYFVIANTAGKRINLEVFNRWGNLIYKSSSYQNDWNGRTTEGVHVGDEVPAGTYYYILTIEGADKRVGYITINR
ncbi:MAG: gliding motility-associated C-terminal domain-containing protein [Pedobacter sp.]|nr:MAG: gliding motility-associated C-terminal domain-containing protein [Pedobacter sp.]